VATGSESLRVSDDWLTVCAISLLAAMLSNVVHEGVGHAAIALLTGAKSGMLSTVAWSSKHDSRLVAAGGTLANLAASVAFWIVLRLVENASVRWRYFLLISFAFNIFEGTGYFLFSGVSNFADWAQVIAGLPAHWIWRTALVLVGVTSYFGAVLAVGVGLLRYVGAARSEPRRLTKLTLIPYFSPLMLVCTAGFLNPMGIQLVRLSALPATAGAKSGLLWLRYYIPKGTVPERRTEGIERSHGWIAVAIILSAAFVLVLGRGITLQR
jgi:hypothetical protein